MAQIVLLQDRIAEPVGAPPNVPYRSPPIDRNGAQEESNPARGICVAAFAGMLCWIGLAVAIF